MPVRQTALPPTRRFAPPVAPARSLKTRIPYADARTVIETLREDLLPAELRGRTPAARSSMWSGWVFRHDAQIRSRLQRGDEDSVANLLLFGTTFLRRPRVEAATSPNGPAALDTIEQRLDDMVSGILRPGTNERLQFARIVIERAGINPATVEGRRQTRVYLEKIARRILNEGEHYDHTLADQPLDFAQRSSLFLDRGLSSDTSIFPNFAIERALTVMASKLALRPASVRRLAVIGPGLDFMNKNGGYDFYPEQTIQPFAIVDSLTRLGLASAELTLTCFDVSGRVNHHLESARRRARGAQGYVVQLVRRTADSWKPELVEYWKRFGDAIGEGVDAAAPPKGVADVEVRAVRVRPPVVLAVRPQDLNIVVERLSSTGDGFDLIIATNIFIYYDVFDQSLALVNVAKMLRPGGFLLSNSSLHELPTIPMSLAGYTDVAYIGVQNEGAGDRLFWYQRQ